MVKILIEGVTILTMDPDNRVVEQGYVYLDKGVIVSVGEGPPPPELEFAEYVIDGRGRVITPGISLGIGDIVKFVFQYHNVCYSDTRQCLTTLSKSDVIALLEVALMTLAMRGVTSLTTLLDREEFLEIAPLLARAASECWIRTRILTDLAFKDAEPAIDAALKNVADRDAVSMSIIRFGVLERGEAAQRIDVNDVVDVVIVDAVKDVGDRALYIDPKIPLKCAIVRDLNSWRKHYGIAFNEARLMNPRLVMENLLYRGFDSVEVLRIVTSYNNSSYRWSEGMIRDGCLADLVIWNLRELPAGPLPTDVDGVYRAIIDGISTVETTLVRGELVVDRGEPITIGRKVVDKAYSVIESIRKRK